MPTITGMCEETREENKAKIVNFNYNLPVILQLNRLNLQSHS